MIPPFQILIQLLYYAIARRERKHANVKVVGWRVSLPLCGEQAIDKERDIREAKSGTCVLNGGPAQNQPIRGVLYSI